MNKISVIITAYNSKEYVTAAIESAIQQTYENIEILVIDDGSTDNTETIINRFMPKVRYVKQENGGPSSARNLGIEKSSGEFLAFLDADDVWMPEKLHEQAAVLRKYESIGMVTCGRIHMDQRGVLVDSFVPSVNGLSSNSLIEALAIGNTIGGASAALIKRSVFDACGIFDRNLRVSEDTDMWIRIAGKYDIKCVEKPLFYYRVVANSQSANAKKNIDNQCQLTNRLLKQGIINRAIWRKALSYKYFCAAWSSLQYNQRKDAFLYIARSFWATPAKFMRNREMMGLAIKILLGNKLFCHLRGDRGDS